jgi:hypothetical protein
MPDQDAVVVLGGEMNHHRSERRLANINLSLTKLSCGWARICRDAKPDHLLYKMEKRFCIKCARSHWFFLEALEFEQPRLDPSKLSLSELEEIGYFEQIDDTK